MRISMVYAMKGGILAEPVAIEREEAVCRSEVYPDCLLGGYLCVLALCVRVDFMSPALFCAKVSL